MEPQHHRPTLLDLPISIFNTAFANTPESVTTLRRIITSRYYQPAIEAIRREPDKAKQKALKNKLRAFTSVSLLHHRKEGTSFAERLAVQWPMLAGDVDKADNPGVNMADLKAKISLLRYVVLCAYSVRGGLWFVVRLPDPQTPDTLAAHFRYLQWLFTQQFGITLDASKGGNPTDLRFVSYDAAPYLNDAATVMAKTYTPPKPKPNAARPRPVRQEHFNGPDEGELLKRLLRYAEGATEGNRHTTLVKAATLAGGYIAAGRMDEQTATYGLETVASEWPTFHKSQKTIRDGIRYGQQKPLYAETPSNDYPQNTRPAPRQQKPDLPDADPIPEKWVMPPAELPAEVAPPPRPNNTMIFNGQMILGEWSLITPGTDCPAQWDEPNAPDAVPTICAVRLTDAGAFHKWQQQHKYFSRHGIASLQPQQQPPAPG